MADRRELERRLLTLVNEAEDVRSLEGAIEPLLRRVVPAGPGVGIRSIARSLIRARDSRSRFRFTAARQITESLCKAVGIGDASAVERLDRTVGGVLATGPWSTHPTLLLPLRLETRFKRGRLLVRIFPDPVFVDSHEPLLTRAELEAAREYGNAPADERPDAWRALARTFGPKRAAWIARRAEDPDLEADPLRPGGWTEAPRLRVLPDRFHVFTYRAGALIHHEASRPVRHGRTLIAEPRPRVDLRLHGRPGTSIPTGARVRHEPTGRTWAVKAEVEIGEDGSVEAEAAAVQGAGAPVIETTTDWSIETEVEGWESAESLGESSVAEGLFDDRSRWMVDFGMALRDGFAVEIGLDPETDFDSHGLPLELDRVIAVGVQWSSAADARRQLEGLLDSHRFTDGLGFVAPGTPTNSTEQRPSGFSSREDHDSEYEVATQEPESWQAEANGEPRSNAHRLSKALGITARALSCAEGAGGVGESLAREMNTVTWPVTGDYFFRELLPKSLDAEQRRYLADHHREFVRGAGPLPTLRIGRQPYGVLPVTRLATAEEESGGWRPAKADAAPNPELDRALHAIVSALYERWLTYAANPRRVPRVVRQDEDPDATLLRILSMQARCTTYRARPFVEERFIGWTLSNLREQAFGQGTAYEASGIAPASWMLRWSASWDEVKGRTADLLGSVSDRAPDMFVAQPLLRTLAWSEGEDEPAGLTRDREEPDRQPAAYLAELWAGSEPSVNTLLADVAGRAIELAGSDAERTVIREAVLRLAGSGVLDFFNGVSSAQEIVDRIEDDPSVHPERRGYGVRRSLAERILQRREELGRFTSLEQIDDIRGAGPDTLHDIVHSLREAPGQADLDRLFRESLDLASHRVDAWVTSFATKRLEGMRARDRSGEGLHLGAYGFVEDLRPRTESGSAGYLHAPSSGQAAAAGVLHNAYRTHDPGWTADPGEERSQNPFRINLTSGRVRQALRILEGVREGEPLGALLGYRLERALKDRDRVLAQYIHDLRDLFPLVAHKVAETKGDEPAESVAARNVVDGAALARDFGKIAGVEDVGDIDEDTCDLGDFLYEVAEAQPDHASSLLTVLRTVADTMDAVSDLLLTESVHQAVQGNFERSAAALEAASGNQSPPELESIATPVSGRTFTHRVCALFNEERSFAHAAARAADPRGAAEPRVAGWFTRLLGASDGPLEETRAFEGIGVGFDFWEEEVDPDALKRVNVNSAAEEELATLPGIDLALAEAIVRKRAEHGPFKHLADLERVAGIGPATVGELREKATTGYVERVNLNRALAEEVRSELGLSDSVISELIAEREERPFRGIEELTRVSGIAPATLDSLRGRIIAPLTDLNRAPAEELEELPRIGSVLAERIVEARRQAEFGGVWDLLRVEGIDDEMVDELSDWVSTDFGVAGLEEIEGLGLSPTDFLYAAQAPPEGGETELEQWVARWVRKEYVLPATQRIQVHAHRHGRFDRSLGDAAELARQAHALLSAGRPMSAATMCHPADADEGGYAQLDVSALRARVREVQRRVSNEGAEGDGGLIQAFEAAVEPSKVAIRLSGEAGTVVPQGTRIRHTLTGTIWATDGDITIAESGGEGEATTVAGRPSLAIPPGGDWTIEDAVPGWKEISSTVPSTPHDPQALDGLLLRSGKYGIPGAVTAGADDPHIAAHFDNALAELRKRLEASRRSMPPLDVNTASLAELEGLLGQELAEKIVEEQDDNGPFADLGDLKGRVQPGDIGDLWNRITTKQTAAAVQVRQLVSAMKALFGESYVVLPTFAPQHGSDLQSALDQDALNGLGKPRLRLWLQQAAEVRPSLRELEDTVMLAEGWGQATLRGTTPSFALELAQLPFADGRAWIGLSDDERGSEAPGPDWVRSPLSLVVASSGPLPTFTDDTGAAARVATAGLLLDEWSELIPAAEVNTSVAFHYDAPNTQPPQSLLLAVPSQLDGVATLWTPEALARIVGDTLDLAKVRAVDLDALAPDPAAPPGVEPEPIGAVLPGIYLPTDPARPGWGRQVATRSIEDLAADLTPRTERNPARPAEIYDDS